MKSTRHVPFVALLGVATMSLAAASFAQTANPPPRGSGDPSAASTPHQRDATGKEGAEAPRTGSTSPDAASSPHQHAAADGKSSDAGIKMAHEKGKTPDSFVKTAAMAGMTEVELAKLALSKSQDAKVRKFADRMIADHGKANKELETLAKAKGITLPTKLDTEHQATVQMLSAKTGADFDAAYAEHMAMDHAKAAALFESAGMLSDAQLSGFAKQTLPTIKEHKQMVQTLPAPSRSAEAGKKPARE